MNVYSAIAISVAIIASGASGFYLDRALATSAVSVCPERVSATTRHFFGAPEVKATGYRGF